MWLFLPFDMTFKLCTFNCRGIQDSFKRKKVFHYFKSVGCDIIFLQETHSLMVDENLWKMQWGEQAWFNSFASNCRGVAILIRNSISVKVNSVYKDREGRCLFLSVTLNDIPILLTNIYAPMMTMLNFILILFPS